MLIFLDTEAGLFLSGTTTYKKQTEEHRCKQVGNFLIQIDAKLSKNRSDDACHAYCAFITAR